MQIKRHKHFRKDELKSKLTDEQYKKRIEYLSCILNGEYLPINQKLNKKYTFLEEKEKQR